jgi:hypothetical protein
MKKTLIAILSIFTIYNVNAMTLQNATLVSSKTWTTGHISGAFIDKASPTNSRLPNSSVSTDARTTSVEGFSHSNTYAYGQHSFYISNSHQEKERYLIEYRLCIDGTNCIYRNDTYDVNPRGTASNSASSSVVGYFDKAGTYDIMVNTKLSGPANDSTTNHARADIRNR